MKPMKGKVPHDVSDLRPQSIEQHNIMSVHAVSPKAQSGRKLNSQTYINFRDFVRNNL